MCRNPRRSTRTAPVRASSCGSAVRKGLIPRSLHAAFQLRWSDRIFELHTRSRVAGRAFARQMSNLLARDASDEWGRGETDFAGSRLGYGTTSKPAWRK